MLKFLINKSATYLLYHWAKFEEENILSFTCVHIPKALIANVDTANATIDKRNQDSRQSTTDELNKQLTKNVGILGQSVSTMARVEMEARLDDLYDKNKN